MVSDYTVKIIFYKLVYNSNLMKSKSKYIIGILNLNIFILDDELNILIKLVCQECQVLYQKQINNSYIRYQFN